MLGLDDNDNDNDDDDDDNNFMLNSKKGATENNSNNNNNAPDINAMAKTVIHTIKELGYNHIDGLCGYSLGGRVVLSMLNLLSFHNNNDEEDDDNNENQQQQQQQQQTLISKDTKIILLGANPLD